MFARICDACGAMYRPYGKVEGTDFEANAMTVVKIEKDGKMHCKARFDLCPTCMKDVVDYIKIDLVQKTSPQYDRWHENEEEAPKEDDQFLAAVSEDSVI